jgi:hypothetical protein
MIPEERYSGMTAFNRLVYSGLISGTQMELMRIVMLSSVFLVATNNTAQGYPNRPVKVIIPFTAGGPTDILGRLIDHNVSKSWG